MTAITIPTITLGPTDNVPLIGQGEEVFSANAQISLTYQAALPAELNASIEQMNLLSEQLNTTSMVLGGYTERYATAVSSIDASLYNTVKATLTGAQAISFVNIPTLNYSCVITVEDGDGTLAITLPANCRTPGGTAPTFTVNGKDKLIFETADQGATWDLAVLNDLKVIA